MMKETWANLGLTTVMAAVLATPLARMLGAAAGTAGAVITACILVYYMSPDRKDALRTEADRILEPDKVTFVTAWIVLVGGMTAGAGLALIWPVEIAAAIGVLAISVVAKDFWGNQ